MDTLYARCQQFATRVYGPLFTAGLHFGGGGVALLGAVPLSRDEPFIEHCALAPLPEKVRSPDRFFPDFVGGANAWAGWGVWIA